MGGHTPNPTQFPILSHVCFLLDTAANPRLLGDLCSDVPLQCLFSLDYLWFVSSSGGRGRRWRKDRQAAPQGWSSLPQVQGQKKLLAKSPRCSHECKYQPTLYYTPKSYGPGMLENADIILTLWAG